MKWSLIAAFATAAAASCSTAVQASLIVNGGFETPLNAPAGGFVTYFGGQSFPGWSVGGNSVDVHHTGHTRAFTGVQSLDLAGNAAGSIAQTIATVPGATYTLSLWYSGHVFHPYSGNAFAEIRWGGALIDVINRPPSPNIVNMNWIQGVYSLTATSTSTELRFVSLSPNGGVILDELNLVVVPEPASVLTLVAVASGLLGLGARRRGRPTSASAGQPLS